MERNLHETTSRGKTYGKWLFSKDFEVQDEYFEIDWYFTRQKVENGTIKVNFISTHD
jgi:hypothetical protein